MNSDCQNPLSCTFGTCHSACKEARDCPDPNQLCVRSPAGNVCTLPTEEKCGLNSQCPQGLYCAKDLKCRVQCQDDRDCTAITPTQTCVLPDGVCAESYELSVNGQLTLPDGAPMEVVDAGAPAADAQIVAAEAGPPDSGVDAQLAPVDVAAPDVATDSPAATPPDAAIDSPAAVDANNLPLPDIAPQRPPPDASPDSAGGLTFTPTNFTVPPELVAHAEDAVNGLPGSYYQQANLTMSDGTMALLYVVRSLRVDNTATLPIDSRYPTIVLALETVDIQGPLIVQPGTTGGFSNGGAPGPGAGKVTPSRGAESGASYCGVGGAAEATMGGKTYGNSEISPLIGGSGSPGAGSGGGALQIVAGKSIIVRALGSINVGGSASGGGSGGSGGALLLEAPSVTILGAVAANGGGGAGNTAGANPTADDRPAPGGAGNSSYGPGGAGSAGSTINGTAGQPADMTMNYGSGGGGAGRIRINTATGAATISGIVSPGLGTPCATQGVLK
jgi:hypothetical protein